MGSVETSNSPHAVGDKANKKGDDIAHLEAVLSMEDVKNSPDLALVDPEVSKYASQRAVHVDEATNKHLKKMIDKRILFMMVGTYFLQALDKGTISFVAIMGIREDLRLVGQQFSWLSTCIYIGVLFVEYPINWLIPRVPLAKFLGTTIILWGITLGMHAVCHNFAGILVARTVLGALEAVCQPSFIIISSTWFTRSEQSAITIYWLLMAELQQVIGSLLGYGFSNIPASSPIKSWRVLYMAYSIVTVLWGSFLLYWMPDSLMKAKCFSEEDKALMIERVRKNQTGVQNRIFRKEQVWEAFKDPQTYAFCVIQITTTIPSGGLSAFSAILAKSFGFETLHTQLLAMVPGVVQITAMLTALYFERKYKQVTLTMLASTLVPLGATVVFLSVQKSDKTRIGLLVAYYLLWSFYAAVDLLFSLMARNVAGQTKKATVVATSFVFWAAGNAAAPQTFQATEAPRYFTAFAVQLTCWVVLATTLILLRFHYMIQNNKKSKKIAEGAAIADADLVHGFEDITDMENINFRYMY